MPHYHQHARKLHSILRLYMPAEKLDALHTKTPWKHFLIAGRQVLLLILLPLLIFNFPNPLVWIPASILMGFVIFSFSVLLHEVIHEAVFVKARPKWSWLLGNFYATCSGLAYSQFRKWHLDHHRELGNEHDDPKRAHLSPKVNKAWYKFLYWTPALFPIYFKAAARAKSGYSSKLQQQIRKERLFGVAVHLSVLVIFCWIDPVFGLKAYVIPVFFIFPIAFSINRLGQHYVINPDNPANWSTLMRPNRVWNFLFLYSSYHLEHHYYPAVPFYRLREVQDQLEQFFRDQEIPTYSYWQLIKLWFVNNHLPHSNPNPVLSETHKKQKTNAIIGDTVEIG
ncbi:MAG: fatty acid desaturase [Bacteroidota bacterium]